MPCILVFAGPNGSGKSTITSHMQTIGAYVNADEIQKHLGCDAYQAARNAEKAREQLLAEGKDFTFETVLSTTRNVSLMKRAKTRGYSIFCIYVLTNDPDVNVSRVVSRARNGGHDVPEKKVRERYVRALRILPQLIPLCTKLFVFDNTNERDCGKPALIVESQNGMVQCYPNNNWDMASIEALLNGTYTERF